MKVSAEESRIVETLFEALRMGPQGEDALIALFSEDAVFVEPFSGQPQAHEGTDAIRESFRSMEDEPEDTTLVLDGLDTDGDRVRADWTSTSSAFPAPFRGHDWLTIRNGKIQRLEVIVTEMPR